MMTRNPFPVLCDRCRAEGLAGEAEFADLVDLADLLDFEPVPRRVERADGWTAEVQRAFVAALAVTGSERQAAAVVGRAQFGVAQLRKAKGNESFLAACAKAMEIHREKERVRRSDGLLAAAHGEAARARGRHRLAWSGAATRALPASERVPTAADEQAAENAKLEALEAIVRKYISKLEQERRARLEGRIAEADFYVRQITFLEVSLDMVSGDGMAVLRDLRCGGHDLREIAVTPVSRLLDEARRLHWDRCGEPSRPDAVPAHLLVWRQGFAFEPLDATVSGHPDGLSHQEQSQRNEERDARDAEAQIAWEAEAREAAAAWRARPVGQARESSPASAGQEGQAAPCSGAAARPPTEDPDEELRQ